MDKISVIVSCFNEEESVPLFYDEIIRVFKNMTVDYELLFVNDGSHDKTLEIIKKLSKKDKCVKYVSFSRNFGKEAAMFAGLQYATGDYVTLMDADLQDPPFLLPKMYDLVKKENYDCVATRRSTRKGEPVIRSFFARKFYKIINKISKTEMVDGARDYRFMTRQMVDSIISMQEYNRYSKGLFSFVGYKTKWLEYENIERKAGTTKWSFWKLLLYAFDGILAFSTVPLVLSFVTGLVFTGGSFIAFIVYIIRAICHMYVSNLAIIIALGVFLSGLQFTFLGIIGAYLAKTYLEVKQRPVYIVKETNYDK